jgi:uncharacterized protein
LTSGRRRAAAAWACGLVLLGWALAAAARPGQCPPTARAPQPAELQAALASARDHGMLWRMAKDGRHAYLYGTLHVGKLAWALPGPALRQALSESEVLALELDVTDARTQQQLQQLAARRAGAAALPAPLRRRLDKARSEACLPEGVLQDRHPVFSVMTLVLLAARWEGLDPAFGLEAMLSGWARQRGMPIVALETVEQQLGALMPKTEADALHMVDQGLTQLESGAARRTVRRLGQAWAGGRLEELAAYEQWCDCVGDERDRELMRRVNDGRNPAIAEAIDRLHGEGRTVFAAVGAGHVQRGFQVERIGFAR